MIPAAFAMWLMGAFLLVVALLVWRIPVPCRHRVHCAACEAEAADLQRRTRQRTIERGHRWHLDPTRGCRRCFPDDDERGS